MSDEGTVVTPESPPEVPPEMLTTIQRCGEIARAYLPNLLSRGFESVRVPAPLKLMARGMMDPDRLAALLPSMLLTLPDEQRLMTVSEAKTFISELIQAFLYAYQPLFTKPEIQEFVDSIYSPEVTENAVHSNE